jgi:3-hydroxybutyryl-CoA dehydrogenase
LIDTVGVIGAGVIGMGVAQVLAEAGLPCVVLDTSEEILTQSRVTLRNNLRLSKLLSRCAEAPSVETLAARVTFSLDWSALARVDFVIENVTEKWALKQPVYQELDRLCGTHVVIAANTSVISISRLASVTNRPDRVIGAHFMNPVPLRPTVEVIKGERTSATTIELTTGLLSRLNKRFVVVNDVPGFVSNRVLMLTLNEAIHVLQDQVASVEEIDEIFKGCFGHPIGPLGTADLIGLDTVLYSLEGLQQVYGDKFAACQLLRDMVLKGALGRKSGTGFYQYS